MVLHESSSRDGSTPRHLVVGRTALGGHVLEAPAGGGRHRPGRCGGCYHRPAIADMLDAGSASRCGNVCVHGHWPAEPPVFSRVGSRPCGARDAIAPGRRRRRMRSSWPRAGCWPPAGAAGTPAHQKAGRRRSRRRGCGVGVSAACSRGGRLELASASLDSDDFSTVPPYCRRPSTPWGGDLLHERNGRGARLSMSRTGPGTPCRSGFSTLPTATQPGAAAMPRKGTKNSTPKSMPQNMPGGSRSDGVMVGGHPQLALAVADDRRHRIGLDHQVLLELPDLVHGRQRGGLVRVADGDQVRHAAPPLVQAAAPQRPSEVMESSRQAASIILMG